MHLTTIRAIIWKDLLDTLKNRTTLVALATPIILAVFSVGVTLLINIDVDRILLYDPANSGIEAIITPAFNRVEITRAASAEEVAATFRTDATNRTDVRYVIGVVVPPDFTTRLQQGTPPDVSLYINRDDVDEDDAMLVESAIQDFGRAITVATPPVTLITTLVNPVRDEGRDLTYFYVVMGLLAAFPVASVLVPGLIIEEKERKTLRFLLVSPASVADILVAKLIVGICYELIIVSVVWVITGGVVGQVPYVALMAVMGSGLGVALGLLSGSVFQTMQGVGIFNAGLGVLFFLPGIIIGPIGVGFRDSPFLGLMRFLPTYWLANTLLDALNAAATPSDVLTTVAIVGTVIVVLCAASVWILREQAGRWAMI